MATAGDVHHGFETESDEEPVSGQIVKLALGQTRILEMIALGAALGETLSELLRFLERDTPEMLCSVLLLDPDGIHLHSCAAPSLPAEYSRSIDGAAIGPQAGSCGTAAYRRERVVVADIESDPLWEPYRELARPYGLRACWSTPIIDSESRVLGTFAMYFRRPASPSPLHERLTEIALRVATIAISRARQEAERHESEERYRLVNLATNDAVWDWDLRTGQLWWNDAVEALFGYAKEEVTTDLEWWTDRVHPEDRSRVEHTFHDAAQNGDHWSEEYRFLRKDGVYAEVQDRGYVLRDSAGTPIRMIGSMQDITERKRQEKRIRDLAFREPVTGLPNRVSLQLRLADAFKNAQSSGSKVALLLTNLNYFRDINDCLGHQNGDALLNHLGKLLVNTMDGAGEVAALGGDEFAILLPHVPESSHVVETIAAVHAALDEPIKLRDIPIKVETTIGVAISPEHGTTVDLLWQHADVALRTAKENFEPHRYYSEAIDHYDPSRLILIGELHGAIDSGQLVLHYQPKIDLGTGRAVGVEALVRWQHPSRGLLFPDTFIPLAERTGLINPLTTAVVISALEQAVNLNRLGFSLGVSVNLSARNLHEPRFAPRLLGLLEKSGFPLSDLTLEITETAIMADPVRAKKVLTELREAGIHLSMDDFGIGQSSLSYLKELPISKMKIDKSFVMDFDRPRNVAVVRSAIDLARNMGLQVTAEGIESEAVYLSLRELGCDIGQGYYFSRPLAPAALMAWLRDSAFGAVAAE
jgi:diguanylate cyclase (GGDEF)-like protein/PAS domain S-box-containing protein